MTLAGLEWMTSQEAPGGPMAPTTLLLAPTRHQTTVSGKDMGVTAVAFVRYRSKAHRCHHAAITITPLFSTTCPQIFVDLAVIWSLTVS